MEEFFDKLDPIQRLPVDVIKAIESDYIFDSDSLFAELGKPTDFFELLKLAAQAFVWAELSKKENWDRKDWDEEALLLASARMYQKAAEIQENRNVIKEDAEWFMIRMRTEAALGFFATLRLSISAPISRKLNSVMDDDLIGQYPIARLYRCITLLTQNRLPEFCDTAERESTWFADELINREFDTLSETEIFLFPAISNTLKTLSRYGHAILNDDWESAENEGKKLRDKARLFAKVGHSELSFFIDKVGYSCARLSYNSYSRLREVLPYETDEQKKQVDAFIQDHLKKGYYFLFNSQCKALFEQTILKGERHQVLSMPTGSGKTLLALLLIFTGLLRRKSNNEKVIFIVPTRALAREKLQEFGEILHDIPELNYRICQITGEYMVDVRKNVEENDLLIMTQEKFDLLIREKFCDATIVALLADEFHNIFKSPRGLKLQISLDRFRFIPAYANCKIYLISAILSESNRSMVANWLYPEENANKQIFRSDWKPMFTRRGIAEKVTSLKSTGKYKLWNVEFDDGQRLHFDNIDDSDGKDMKVKMAVRQLAVGLAKLDQLYFFSSGKDSVLDTAVELQEILPTNPFPYISQEFADKRRQLSKKIGRLIGNSNVKNAFEKGIATHHGDFPIALRRIMEKSVKEKVVGILVATNTLADGLNMPVRTILIPKTKLAGDDMEISLFLNLAGRAGRPFLSEEGQVIIVDTEKGSDPKKYYEANENSIEVLPGPIVEYFDIQRELVDVTNKTTKKLYERILVNYKATIESLMLAVLAEEIYPRLSGEETLIDSLLFNSGRIELREQVNALLTETEKRFVEEYEVIEPSDIENSYNVTERGMAIYRSGFSPGSGLETIKWLDENQDIVNYFSNEKMDIYDDDFYDYWVRLIVKIVQTDECQVFLRLGEFGTPLTEKQIPLIAIKWIKEHDIHLIASDFFKKNKGNEAMFFCLSFLEGKLCPSLSWGLYGIAQWVDATTSGRKNALKENLLKLATMIWFGCSGYYTLKICSYDDSRLLLRNDIIKLSEKIVSKEIPNFLNKPELINSEEFRKGLETGDDNWMIEPNDLIKDLKIVFGV